MQEWTDCLSVDDFASELTDSLSVDVFANELNDFLSVAEFAIFCACGGKLSAWGWGLSQRHHDHDGPPATASTTAHPILALPRCRHSRIIIL